MTSRRLLATPLLAAIALAACGGSDAPSKAEFASQAEKVCADIEKAGESLGSPDSFGEISSFVDRTEKAVDDGVARLKELEVPEGKDGEKAREFVGAVESEANDGFKPALQDLRKAADEKDQQKLQAAAERIQKVDTGRSERLAREIGARGCAE